MAAVAVKYPAFRELGAEVLAVSVDSPATHREWQEKELSRIVTDGALYPLLSDPCGSIGSLFGAYDPNTGLDLRSHFLIDPQGLIQAMEILAAPIGRNIAEILRQLRALQHHQATGEFMPCGWEPGKPTLTKGADTPSTAGKVWETWKPRSSPWVC
jgi:peroxiredoxin (alkyl hydroperoxide reductase subunit C)